MKWINNFEPLIVNKINTDNTKLKEYSQNTWLINDKNREYLIIKRNFENKIKAVPNINVEHEKFKFYIEDDVEDKLKLSLNYGDEQSFIIDMNGIDNFIFAESQVFDDSTIRKIVKKLGLLDDSNQYLRIGASGARPNSIHPGGEVLEYSLINGKDVDGLSQNVSGYLPRDKCYSKSIPLYNEDKKTLREERTVYSHTAWLKECEIKDSRAILINIIAKENKQSLLDILRDIAIELNLKSYSMQIYIKSLNDYDTEIKGRVLKHIPEHPFKDIPEIVDISYEKLYKLTNLEVMYGMGTKYERYEPEWTEFTDGGIYERRGHIHATIMYNKENELSEKKHETFHLRDVFISPKTEVKVIFNPIDTVYRIYPIHKKDKIYICDASKKNIDDVINKIRSIDIKVK